MAKTKAQTILGWISCSPTPLTTRELEQAWEVNKNPESRRSPPRLNILELCGPIVEIVDDYDYVQFVHFTVKEYDTIHDTALTRRLTTALL